VSSQPTDPTPDASPTERFAGMRPLTPHEDERPSREDRGYGHSPFEIPIPLPKWLLSRKERRGER
jgi:hypothetical protein